MHNKAYRHVAHRGNGCEWVDAGQKLVRVGGRGLKMNGSDLKMSGSGWDWLGVDGSG